MMAGGLHLPEPIGAALGRAGPDLGPTRHGSTIARLTVGGILRLREGAIRVGTQLLEQRLGRHLVGACVLRAILQRWPVKGG